MKKKGYQALDFYDNARALPLSRREFMKLAGGGIVVLFTVEGPSSLEAQRERGQSLPED
jgi:hypothetical protein